MLTACAATPAPEAGAGDRQRTVVSLPLDMGKLKLASSYEYPDPVLGSVYGYAGDFALYPDVYVYPNPFLDQAAPPVAVAASPAWAAASFEEEMAYVVERGGYESAEVTDVSDFACDWKYGTLSGRRVSMTTVRGGRELYSRAYFFAVRELLLKVRMSYFDYPGLRGNMDWFVEQLIGGMRIVRQAEGGGHALELDPAGDVERQLMSRMDDLVVLRTRNELMEQAISGREDGRILYGDFGRREPIRGPSEAGLVSPEGTRDAAVPGARQGSAAQ